MEEKESKEEQLRSIGAKGEGQHEKEGKGHVLDQKLTMGVTASTYEGVVKGHVLDQNLTMGVTASTDERVPDWLRSAPKVQTKRSPSATAATAVATIDSAYGRSTSEPRAFGPARVRRTTRPARLSEGPIRTTRRRPF